jgi:hypothetical protein
MFCISEFSPILFYTFNNKKYLEDLDYFMLFS